VCIHDIFLSQLCFQRGSTFRGGCAATDEEKDDRRAFQGGCAATDAEKGDTEKGKGGMDCVAQLMKTCRTGDVAQFRHVLNRYRTVLRNHITWQRAFNTACAHGHMAIIHIWIDEYSVIPSYDSWRAGLDHYDVVEFFIERDGYILKNIGIVREVFKRNNPRIVELFLRTRKLDMHYAVCGAYEGGHIALITQLHKLSIHAVEVYVYWACMGGQLELVKSILKSSNCGILSEQHMEAACRSGNLELIKFIDQCGHHLSPANLSVVQCPKVAAYIFEREPTFSYRFSVDKIQGSCVYGNADLIRVLNTSISDVSPRPWRHIIWSGARYPDIIKYAISCMPPPIDWAYIMKCVIGADPTPVEIVALAAPHVSGSLINTILCNVSSMDVLHVLRPYITNYTGIPLHYIHALLDCGVTFKQLWAHKGSYMYEREVQRLHKKYRRRYAALQEALHMPKVIVQIILDNCEYG
jgi:hypothetical protein